MTDLAARPDHPTSASDSIVKGRERLVTRLWKPWYVWRPQQLLLRTLRAAFAPRPGFRPLRVAWGASLLADPTKTIGRSIWTTGVYDLTVSEVLARLIRPGDLVVDAGANIGYMTVLAAVAATDAGQVLSFEPHPDLFAILQRNVDTASRTLAIAPTSLRNVALGEAAGTAELVLPDEMSHNDGVAYIARGDREAGRTVAVAVETLDAALGPQSAAVMKLDVEGYEMPVLKGATQALTSRRIRHIIFEDHEGGASPVARFLEDAGYHLYSMGWTIQGPQLGPPRASRLAADYEAPSYLASLEPDEARERCSAPGWLVLSGRLARR